MSKAQPLNILIINWRDIRNPEAGGAELHLHEVALRLVKAGHSCVLYSHAYDGAPTEETIDGIKVYRRGSRLLFNFTVWFHVRSWENKHKPDVIIDDSNKAPFFLPWLCQAPVVVRIHHLFGKVFFKETGFIQALYLFLLERFAAFSWRNRPVIAVSESTRKDLTRLGVHGVTIALNGVDASQYRLGTPVPKKPYTIVYMGRLKKYKGLDVIFHAIARLQERLPDIRLEVAGRGDDKPRLEALASSLGISNQVSFLGFITEAEKVRLYTEAAIVANTSLKEGYGLTIIEANACGTAVVATDVPGLCDSVKDGITGFLVPRNDSKAFADKLCFLLENPDKRREMEKACLEWAGEHNWGNTFDVTQEVLTKAAMTGQYIQRKGAKAQS
ncbi:MAG: glycosyltransferase family 4 protein [Fibrobacteria bacterium]|nr:glycosyltransferase family 4 protein [Fibrobacteria bacterium]